MDENRYSRDLVKDFNAYMDGETLVLDGDVHVENEVLIIEQTNFFPSKFDYSNRDEVILLASSAVNTADGFCELVEKNFDTTSSDVLKEKHLEMYLALAGFACEIYMKAIIYFEDLHKNEKIKTHELNKLYNKLPFELQKTIADEFGNISDILEEIKDVFTELRYNFEVSSIRGDYLIVFRLMKFLKVVAHGYPQKKTGAIKYANGILSFE